MVSELMTTMAFETVRIYFLADAFLLPSPS